MKELYFNQFTIEELKDKANKYNTWEKYLSRVAEAIDRQYDEATIAFAWSNISEAPEDLQWSICRYHCCDSYIIQRDLYLSEVTIREALAKQRHDSWIDSITDEEAMELRHIAGTESFEVFLDAWPETFSDSLDIPEEIYEQYIYWRNDYYTRSDFENMIEEEVM